MDVVQKSEEIKIIACTSEQLDDFQLTTYTQVLSTLATSTTTGWELISLLANRNCKLCRKPITLTDPLRKNVNSDHSQAAQWPCRVDQRPELAWKSGGGGCWRKIYFRKDKDKHTCSWRQHTHLFRGEVLLGAEQVRRDEGLAGLYGRHEAVETQEEDSQLPLVAVVDHGRGVFGGPLHVFSLCCRHRCGRCWLLHVFLPIQPITAPRGVVSCHGLVQERHCSVPLMQRKWHRVTTKQSKPVALDFRRALTASLHQASLQRLKNYRFNSVITTQLKCYKQSFP